MASRNCTLALLVAHFACLAGLSHASPPLVPGTGQPLTVVGDDFESDDWSYTFNLPKGSQDVDGRLRKPFGYSQNGRWYEGTDRGQPDFIRRVPTPEGGLPDSQWSLLIASHYTGVPGVGNNQRAQDDLFMNVDSRLGRYIPVSQRPNLVVRVYVPPFEDWEKHNGSSFGVRVTARGITPDEDETEPYWPGMFFNYYPAGRRGAPDEAWLAVRARESGHDYKIKKVVETGWWTLGMSFTPDGRVHYYARPGIEDLTEADHLASHYPYNFRAHYFINVFFDVFSQNDGRSGSTPWIIDDPTVYVADPSILVRKPTRRTAQQPIRRRGA
jgi:hypothetical protein